MKMSRQFYQRLGAMEAKGIIRRVRTPAGARKYGQPIGTVIMPDLTPDIAEAKPPKAGKISKSKASKWQFRDYTTLPNQGPAKRINKLSDLEYTADPNIPTREFAKMGPVIIERYSYDRRFGEPGTDYYYYARMNRATKIDGLYVEKETGEARHGSGYKEAQMVRLANKHRNKPEVRRTPRETSSLMDYWEGTYGWDWQNEDDNITEADFEDEIKRTKIAIKESIELGISVNGYESYGTVESLDIGIHEMLNTTMRAYKEMYPGFVENLINMFGVEKPRKESNVAWNSKVFKWHVDSTGERKMRQSTAINFNNALWSESEDDEKVKALTNAKTDSNRTGWSSVLDLEAYAEEHDLEPWQVASMQVLNHELGHTVGRAIFGELEGWEGIDREAWREEYAANVTPILEKYGLIRTEDALWNTDTTDAWKTLGIKNPFAKKTSMSLPTGFDKDMVMAHLSEYGATNLHEVMAETWASFMMESEPTEFVQELGEAMENMLLLWLEEAGLDK